MARVDIIIPAFNAARYLPSALESVASQTYEDWQIVLLDDGSTDNTEKVVAPFLDRFGSKLKYLQQENHGLPAARNAAIRASKSEFIALLDADDIWLPCRLSESIGKLDQHREAGISYGLISTIDQDGKLRSTWPGNPKYTSGRIAPQIYRRIVDIPCPTITFRRKCLDEVGLFDENLRATEDRDLCLRIALRYEVAFIPKVLAYYRQSTQSMSGDPWRMLEAQLKFISKHYGEEGCGLRSRQVSMARSYRQFAEALSLRNRADDALRSSLWSVVLNPFSVDNCGTAASLFVNWLRCSSRRAGLGN